MIGKTSIRRGSGGAATRAIILAALVPLLAGCGLFGSKKEPPCPRVSVLSDASNLTRFRPGPGRDITDVTLTAEITGFKGGCTWDNDKKILTVALQVEMDLRRGPAASGDEAEVTYFVAVPRLYPDPKAKMILPVKTKFPSGADRLHVMDNEVDVNLPIKDMNNDVDKDDIVLGLQLDQAELEYNRRRKPGS